MKKGDPELTLDHRAILENTAMIGGKWNYELIARSSKLYDEGDVLFGFSGGGPGYGDPLERDPELIMEDLRKNIVSEWTARNIYRIAYDPERRKLDVEKTKQLRDEDRKARLARGRSYEEFVRDWSKLSPPQEVLQWYGSWPDAKPLRPIFRP